VPPYSTNSTRVWVADEEYESTVTGEGHEWPGGPTLPPALVTILGPQSNAIDANKTMWSFFQAHPMR
jgi:poly(3-hydroxybutyrate) depolymerase